MFEIYELSLRSRIEWVALAAFLANSLGVDDGLIVTSSEYWGVAGTLEEKAIGLDVLLSDAGFLTLCLWHQRGERSPFDLLKVAMQASATFRTDTVIGNNFEPAEMSTGQFLLVTAENKVFRAYATTNSAIFEVELVDGKEITFDELFVMHQRGRRETG